MNADLLRGFYLSDLLVEPTKGRVTGHEGSERLASKAVEVLLCLAAQPGELVTREELLEKVWGKDAGSPEALSHAIGEIRHALHDHHDDPEYIQTLPKRGYRLLITPAPAEGDTGTVVLGAKNSIGAHELGLFENLKQRGVLETGLAYLIVGWLLIQIADIVFSQLLLPQWVGTFVTVLVIAGFPIAIALSWFLEFRHGRAVVHELSPRTLADVASAGPMCPLSARLASPPLLYSSMTRVSACRKKKDPMQWLLPKRPLCRPFWTTPSPYCPSSISTEVKQLRFFRMDS